MRDNPPEDWSERTTRNGTPRRKAGKSGPARGGDRDYRVAVRDAVAQVEGLKDALREQTVEAQIAQDANMHLRRDLTAVQEDVKEAHERLGLRRNWVDHIHADARRNFQCKWADETPRAWLTLFILVILVPICHVLLAAYIDEELLTLWPLWIAELLYEGAAFYLDRYFCTKRGYRTLFSQRATHSYSTVDMQDWDDSDRRASTMSLRQLEHPDARYGIVKYTYTLNGINIRRDVFGKLNEADLMLVSFELLSQLTTPLVMLSRDQNTAWERMETLAKSTHTVNVDKDLFVAGRDVVGNTIQVAHGLWLQNRQRRLGHFRPTPA